MLKIAARLPELMARALAGDPTAIAILLVAGIKIISDSSSQ